MNDYRTPSSGPGRPFQIAIGLVSALVAMLGLATAVGASPALRASLKVGDGAQRVGTVSVAPRAVPAVEALGLARRHLAHQRRPAFVAAATAAIQAGLATTVEGVAPVVGTVPVPLPVIPEPAAVATPVATPVTETPAQPETPAEPTPPPAEEPTAPAPESDEPEEPAPVEPEEPAPPVSKPEPEPEPVEEALIDAGFEQGLTGWSTAGVGEVIPKVATDIVRDGSKASKVVLTGEQDRSELILGGNGGGSTSEVVEFHEGDEYWFGFSFYIQSMIYGHPGAHNLIMQFKSNGEGSPNFGLQLWDFNGERGLWSAGDAMQIGGGGERFLSPVSEDSWHDAQIHFRASSQGAGFYEIFLDGRLIDSLSGVSMIVPGHSSAYIKEGLYRNGEEIPGTSDLRIDATKLGETQESVLP